MSINKQEKIDKFVLGRMSGDEKDKFINECCQDKQLRENVHFTDSVCKAIKSRNDKLKALSQFEEAYKKEKKKKILINKPFLWISTIAAIFILCLLPLNKLYNNIDERNKLVNESQVNINALLSDLSIGSYDSLFLQKMDTLLKSNKPNELLAVVTDTEEHLMARLDKKLKQKGNLSTTHAKSSFKVNDKMTFGNHKDSLVTCDDMMKETRVGDLENQLHTISWLKANILLSMFRIDETLTILDLLRQSNSKYNLKADSLYHKLKK